MDFLKLKYNFTSDFFTKRLVYQFYDNVLNNTNNENYINKASTIAKVEKNKIYVVNHIPPYFDLKIRKSLPFNLFKTYQLNGYLANLDKYTSINEYMKEQFGSKSRSKMRMYLRRLETCFDIRYEMFYGNITKTEYEYLFGQLHDLITRRFLQRGNTHQSLANWKLLKKLSYPMILKKEASLFVIYDNKKPVDICLNYHHQNILQNSIRSYDIDYSKFKLGYIDILKQLDWCFKNNFKIFDLSYGDLEYKRRWCNVTYQFEQQVLYNRNHFGKKLLAYIIVQLLALKGFLKKYNVHILYHKVKFLFKRKEKNRSKFISYIFNKEKLIDGSIDTNKTIQININQEQYSYIRKPVYDFQYLCQEATSDVKIYKLTDQSDSYVIIGNKNKEKITLI